MKGSYKIIVQNSNVRYEFEIRRNITIIKGDSATGKTTLVEMIGEFYENGLSSGIELFCKKNVFGTRRSQLEVCTGNNA